jgi:hypothetical protein
MNLPGLKDLNGYPINKKLFQNNSKEREISKTCRKFNFSGRKPEYGQTGQIPSELSLSERLNT